MQQFFQLESSNGTHSSCTILFLMTKGTGGFKEEDGEAAKKIWSVKGGGGVTENKSSIDLIVQKS